MPETVPYNSGLLLADTHSEYTARCMSKRTPSHSIEDLCTANLSMMKRIPEKNRSSRSSREISIRLCSVRTRRWRALP